MDDIIQRKLLNIVKKPIITDKTTKLLEKNQYCFQVNYNTSKKIIKQAIEYIFSVKVIKINTYHAPRKQRKVGRFHGYKPHHKKAIVTLSPNNKINLFSNK